jgi:hypothetical protein
MANYFTLTYDTTGPASPSISINSGAQYTNAVLVTCTIGTTDGTTTGYQMQIWGDIDVSWGVANGVLNSSATTATQSDAQWISYATSKQIQLSTGDGVKTLNIVIRDDVNNPSAQASDTINLDTALPTVTITGPDVTKISNQTGKNISSFSFQSSADYQSYVVKVVSSTGADHTTGTQIPTTGGSTNMSGASGTASTVVNCKIYGADLATASAGDGDKIIKVFVQDVAGNWSV